LKPRAIILVWLILVGFVAYFGFFWPGHDSTTLVYAGIGFTLATCLAASMYTLQKVRAKSVTGFSGILLVLFSSVAAALIPPFVMARSGYYHGESTLAVAYTGGLCIGISLIIFVLFDIAILVLYLRRHDP
jgi:hypothetical protein